MGFLVFFYWFFGVNDLVMFFFILVWGVVDVFIECDFL